MFDHQRLRSAGACTQSDQSSQDTLRVATDPKCLQAESEDSDQSERMRRLV